MPSRARFHHPAGPGYRRRLALSVVVPTRNEAGNVGELLRRLELALGRTDAEVLFVDDSDHDTPAAPGFGRSRRTWSCWPWSSPSGTS
jgi:hypothetical protein